MRNTAIITAAALAAFAANSVLCRAALSEELVDPVSFSVIRVASGALALGVFVLLKSATLANIRVEWRQAALLAGYVVCFSLAYRWIPTGTGALILFGSVQITMLTAAWREGERFSGPARAGFALAVLGLGYLMAPGVRAPSPQGAALMAAAGACWGLYTLLGRGAADPLRATTGNFMAAVPITLILSLPFLGWNEFSLTTSGFLLGAASGIGASAIGYALWFTALRGLSASQAAVVQLAVPVIAAISGAWFLSEVLEPRFIVAAGATLCGIWLVLVQRQRKRAR